VPLADAASFGWPGPWIARCPARDGSGPRAVVMFGVPSGVLWDPADTAEKILGGYLVGAHDVATWSPRTAATSTTVAMSSCAAPTSTRSSAATSCSARSRCRGRRLCEPCAHLDRLNGGGILRPLVHRGGLRADIVSEGTIRVGDALTPA
jgi:hypothetical protein